jgi:hypothetical protein
MPWHQLQVDDEMRDPTHLIHRTFPALYEAAGRPSDMAIFVRRKVGTNCHTFYFAPGAQGFAKCVAATPCHRPTREDMSLIAGEPSSWALLSA